MVLSIEEQEPMLHERILASLALVFSMTSHIVWYITVIILQK